ncbi:MAG: hypothetical protein M1436_04765 [Acidobacteria bacterium]|nr:hypothetical protein [Acidobacteriota bacterium]
MPTSALPFNAYLLERIAPVVSSYQPPEGPFDPAGEWVQTWQHFEVPGVTAKEVYFMPQGEFRLARSKTRRGFTLDVRSSRRGTSEFYFFVDAQFECAMGPVGALESWKSFSRMARTAEEDPYLGSGLRKQGRVERGAAVIATGNHKRRVSVPVEPCAAKWTLMEAAQRFPRKTDATAHFSLLDEVDEIRGNQEFRFRLVEPVILGGKQTPLAVYEHTGTGVIPTTYWVDEANRVLFAVTGCELFVLKESCGKPARYQIERRGGGR